MPRRPSRKSSKRSRGISAAVEPTTRLFPRFRWLRVELQLKQRNGVMPELLDTAVSPHRRGFLKTLGGGILVLLTPDHDSFAQESGRHRKSSEDLPKNIGAWLHIAPDGTITAFTGKAEVGQNIRTSLTQAVADELRCSPASVHLVMGDTALTPWDMGTFGS